jgi:hypothetical protein
MRAAMLRSAALRAWATRSGTLRPDIFSFFAAPPGTGTGSSRPLGFFSLFNGFHAMADRAENPRVQKSFRQV